MDGCAVLFTDVHLHLVPPSSFVLCESACTHLWVCLFGFVCRYVHVWVKANGGAAQPGMKTASQTDWGSGSESAMSKHKPAQSVMNQRRDHDATLHHLAWSAKAQFWKLINPLRWWVGFTQENGLELLVVQNKQSQDVTLFVVGKCDGSSQLFSNTVQHWDIHTRYLKNRM